MVTLSEAAAVVTSAPTSTVVELPSGKSMVRAAVTAPDAYVLLVAAAPILNPRKGFAAVPKSNPPAAPGNIEEVILQVSQFCGVRLGTGVMLATTRGAVPVAAVAVYCSICMAPEGKRFPAFLPLLSWNVAIRVPPNLWRIARSFWLPVIELKPIPAGLGLIALMKDVFEKENISVEDESVPEIRGAVLLSM